MKKGLSILRDENGIPHITATAKPDLFWGQGYAHARDRGLQMLLMRILGQGRGSEFLDAGDDMLAIDIFFRRMNWTGHTGNWEADLAPAEQACLISYCDGVNAGFDAKLPWELKLLGYAHTPWTPEDSILLIRMMGYLTLAQSQGEMERLLVEMIQAGISKEKLDALFPGLLQGLDIPLVQKIRLGERIVSPPSLWGRGLPRMMASNNWVVAGRKTASGAPMVCNDPHLEINRLPNVWYEIVLKSGSRYQIGASMPGIPGILTGRSESVAWGVTYAFIDATDSWIEKCRKGSYLQEDEWIPFERRQEIIRRKKKEPARVTFYENSHGVLDGDPDEDGYYLATCWAGARLGTASLSAILRLWEADTLDRAMSLFRKIETGWSFVAADVQGDIGFQMSGRVPERAPGASGFIPLPGWKRENDWQGFIDPGKMPRVKNPETGYFSTANQNLNGYGKASPITVSMGSYRSDRIDRLLEGKENLTPMDMYAIHQDLYSIQAELFMEIIRPLLPDTPQGNILKDWDLCYDKDSKGAFLFERIYAQLYRIVFGKNGMGEAVVDFLGGETGIFIDFYDNFDTVLLSETSPWFDDQTREEIYSPAIARGLDANPRPWGESRKFPLSHILFGGKLPRIFGFDRGPLTGIGSRATVHQGQIYRSGGRDTTFMPSLRMVSDLGNGACYTNMVGGPSDRRFSKWYCSDLDNWLNSRYKEIAPDLKRGVKGGTPL